MTEVKQTSGKGDVTLGRKDPFRRRGSTCVFLVLTSLLLAGCQRARDGESKTSTGEREVSLGEAEQSWLKAYYDYLSTDSQGVMLLNARNGTWDGEEGYRYNLIYVDDDRIPEIYLGDPAGEGDVLLYFSDGRVVYENIGLTDGGIGYVPYSGVLQGHVGMGSGVDVTYGLEDGRFTEIGREGYGSFVLDGQEVTEEQYRQVIDGYIDSRELQE